MPMTPEGKVKAEVKKILDAHEAWWFMPVGGMYGRAGIPDFVVCHHGKFLTVETKAGRYKTTGFQKREMESIRKAGGFTLVIRPETLNLLEEWLRWNESETSSDSTRRESSWRPSTGTTPT